MRESETVRSLPAIAASLCLLMTAAGAQEYEFVLQDNDPQATVIQQENPGYPGSSVRRGQEGWVRLNYVISADGRALDPIVVDSVGGAPFEEEVLEALDSWRFDNTTGHELPFNEVVVRFEIADRKDAATSKFLKRYRRIMTHLHYDEPENARKSVTSAAKVGGWNLYEETMLSLMSGRTEAAEGKPAGQLEYYLRALDVGTRKMLDGEDRIDALAKTLDLQLELGQVAGAQRTLDLLIAEDGSRATLEKRSEAIAALTAQLENDTPSTARATIHNHCNCETGTPLWSYVPRHRTFSVRNVDGEVDAVELRCNNHRSRVAFTTDLQISAPAGSEGCKVFVFGRDGTAFDFIDGAWVDATPVEATGT